MADEIHVGNVAVGVVPDLRGFNNTLRRDLVPAADSVGREMGTAMTRGITANLDLGKAVRDSATRGVGSLNAAADRVGRDFGSRMSNAIAASVNVGAAIDSSARKSATQVATAADRVGRDFGSRAGKAISASIGIGADVSDSARRGEAETARAGDRTGKVFADSAKARIDAELAGYHPDVTVDVHADTLKARAAIATLGRDITVNVRQAIDDGITSSGLGGDGGGGGGLASIIGGIISGGGGFAGGIAGGQTAGSAVGRSTGSLAGLRAEAKRIADNYLSGGGGGAGAGAGAGAGGAGGLGGGIGGGAGGAGGLFGALPPQAKGALIAAAAAAAPFIAQAVSGAIVSGFGLGIAGIAILGASKTQQVSDAFDTMKVNVMSDINDIGQAFVPVLVSILNAVGDVADKMEPVFAGAAKIIAGPFKLFADTLISSFGSPQVQTSITAVATAFAGILNALSPQLPGIINAFADAITQIAQAVAKNPKAFAAFIKFIFDVGVAALRIIAWLTEVAVWIEGHWTNAWRRMGIDLGSIWHGVLIIFKTSFDLIMTLIKTFIDLVTGNWKAFHKDIIRIGRDFWTILTAIWRNGLIPLWNFIRTWLNRIKGLFDALWRGIVSAARSGWNWLSGLFAEMQHEIAHDFDTIRHGVAYIWDLMWNNTIGRAKRGWQDLSDVFTSSWKWIYDHVWTPVKNFFTTTLPGWFDTAVSAVGKVWDKIKSIVGTPIRWVAQHVLIPLFNGIDDITNFVGLKKPLQGTVNALNSIPKMARGGKLPGYGGGDIIPALLEPGETVVDKDRSRWLAGAFRAAGVPGYQQGGGVGRGNNIPRVAYTNPVGAGAVGARIDMGVDYTGSFPLYALGAGTILNLYNTGWPGGTYMTLRLDTGPDAGKIWYYAEHIVPDMRVGPGIHVDRGQKIGWAPGGYPWTELGWSYNATGTTMAAATGQSSRGSASGDPGRYSTQWGVDANNLIVQLGGPSGIVSPGGITGGGHGIFPLIGGWIVRTVEQILGGIGKFAGVAISLAKGDLGGAVSKLIGSVAHGAGGAGGILSNVLLKLPGQLVHSALSHIMSSVKSFVSGQQSGGGIPSAAAAGSGPAQQIARRLLAAMGWSNQWDAFNALVMSESGWDVHIVNPTSGAYGIPQALPASKMASAGPDWRDSAATQLRWMMGYISQRYGDPNKAWAFHRANNYYALGGTIDEPVNGLGLWSGQSYSFAERGREWVLNRDQVQGLALARGNGNGGPTYSAHFDSLTGAAIESHVQSAFQAMALTQGHLNRSGRRS